MENQTFAHGAAKVQKEPIRPDAADFVNGCFAYCETASALFSDFNQNAVWRVSSNLAPV
jgi:hypothetical protein